MKQLLTEEPTDKDLKLVKQKIYFLKEKAKQSEKEAKAGVEAQIRAAENQFALLRARMKEASVRSEIAGDELASGVRKAWLELQKSVDRAKEMIH